MDANTIKLSINGNICRTNILILIWSETNRWIGILILAFALPTLAIAGNSTSPPKGLSGLELAKHNFSLAFNDKDMQVTDSLFEGMYLVLHTSGGYAPWLVNESVNIIYDTRWKKVTERGLIDMNDSEAEPLRKELMRSIKFDELITYKYGKGDQKIILFSSFDCSQCRRLEKMLDKVGNDINMTIYLIPSTLDPNIQKNKAVLSAILCAENPKQAWRQLMLRNITPTSTSTSTQCELAKQNNNYTTKSNYMVTKLLIPKRTDASPVWLFQSGGYSTGVSKSEAGLKEFLMVDSRETQGNNVYSEPKKIELRSYMKLP